MDDPIWDATVYSKNQERLLAGEVAEAFFDPVLAEAKARDRLSDEPFTVDGTLLEAWASQKSFPRKDAPEGPPPEDPGHPTVDFHQEKRRNETHQSTTGPEARLARKGKGKAARRLDLHLHGRRRQLGSDSKLGDRGRPAAGSGPRGRLRRSVSKGRNRVGKGKRQGPTGLLARFTTNLTAQRKSADQN